MTKDVQNVKTIAETSGIPDFGPMAMYQEIMSKYTQAFATDGNPAAGWFELNQQWINFVGERIKQDAALVQKLGKCSNAAEMTAVWDAFAKEAFQDYRLEFAEMTELSQEAFIRFMNSSLAGTNQSKTTKR